MAGMKSTLIALLTLGLCLPLLAQNKPKPDAAKRNDEWQKEEMCQFVFFAVLKAFIAMEFRMKLSTQSSATRY